MGRKDGPLRTGNRRLVMLAVSCLLAAIVGIPAMSAAAAVAHPVDRAMLARVRCRCGDVANAQVAPATTVLGRTFSWQPIHGVKAYILMTKVTGKAARYSTPSTTSITPNAATATVQYAVRTDVKGSSWSATATISAHRPAYRGGNSAGVPGVGAGSEGSSPREASSESNEALSKSSEAPARPGETSTGSSNGTESNKAPSKLDKAPSETGESPLEETPDPSNLIVGTNGLVEGGPAQVAAYKSILHTRYMRLDAGNGMSGWLSSDMPAYIKEVVTDYDVTPLILYNPAEPGKETLAGRPVGTVRAEVKALGEVMRSLGLKWMEFGNEEYFYEQPGEYAKQYMAAMEALSGMGITLIPDAWGDYLNTEKGPGHEYWSQVRNGGGWWVDFVNDVKALGGGLPAACSLHPYGPMNGSEYFGAGDGPSGWMSVPAMHQWMVEKHVAVPIWITEVGGETYGSSDEIDTEASLAARTKTYIEDSYRWSSYVHALFIYSIRDETEQGYGLFKQNYTPKQAASAFGETVASLGLESA
jgi:hypothetical protein